MDNMEKELWDAFYGKESKQERCSVLTEAELNKHNKGILNEDFEVQPDLLDNEYDVTYKNGRRVYDFHTIYKALEKLLPDWEYTGDAYNGDELNLIYVPKNSKASLNKEMLSDLRKAMAEKFGNDVIARAGRSEYAPEQKKLFIGYLDSGDDYNIPEEELDEGCGKKALKESDEDMSGYEDILNKTIKSEIKKFPKYAANAKKALDDGDEIKKILNKYNQEYNFLYNNHDKVAGYEEAVRAWDEYINHPDFRELIGKLIKARHDMFTSDREIGALMFALDALGYLDKFDGKESSLEPVVKEFKA